MKKPTTPPEPKDNLREVVETIVFVVVLVLILKSFAAEAFVIPTGSMAETLYGYQRNVSCPQCGFEFPVNVSRQVDPQDGPAVQITGCTCPNCRYHIAFPSKDNTYSSGDRVLVAKFLWDLLASSPHRFDVSVFKFPEAPLQKQTPMNYIKRTVGLGGETIGIYYGKLYILPGLQYDESLADPLDRWQPQHMHGDDFSALLQHERAFQMLFDAFLEARAEPDMQQAAGHRAELRRLFHELAAYRNQAPDLDKALNGGYLKYPELDVSPSAIARLILNNAVSIQRSLDKQPQVERLLSQLRDEREAMDAALGRLAGKLRNRKDAEPFTGLLQDDAEARRLLGILLDHEAELKTLRDQGQLRFRIVRRTPERLLSMARIVYDNDAQAKDMTTQPARWQGMGENGAADNTAWAASDGNKVYTHAAAPGAWHWLRYQHRLRRDGDSAVVGDPELITDFMGYNTYEEQGSSHGQPNNWVGDLTLECETTVSQAEGLLTLQLSKGQDRFEAVFNLQEGTCTLRRLTFEERGGTLKLKDEKVLERRPSPLSKPGTYALRFANIDERLVVWVDGKLLFGDGVEYDAPERRGPTVNDLQPASIGVQGAGVKVQHLKLWRDTYYTAQTYVNKSRDGEPALKREDRSNPAEWGPLRDLPARTLFVQPGHYLCMGDNSPESSDSRFWGQVPGRLMLGRALLIYWPVPRAGRIR
jgi:signal peptidase I